MKDIIERIHNLDYSICVIGLGYVGLPLALEFGNAGFKVVGYDIDSRKIELLRNNRSYLSNISFSTVSFFPTSNIDDIMNCDCYIICVPTPLKEDRTPDLSFVVDTVESIQPYIHHKNLVVLESTTYPGTTRDVVKEICDRGVTSNAGKIFDREKSFDTELRSLTYFLAFSPEREDPGSSDLSISKAPKVVGGVDKSSTQVAVELYSSICSEVVSVSSSEVAEATKLLENIYRSVNIALVNELKIIFDKMGIDIWEVVEAASTKPRGFSPFYPGPGLGGHCIPIDPFYLTWKARQYNLNTRFIELAGEVNTSMPDYVVSKIVGLLNDNGCSVKGSRILIVGIAYKKNVDDTRESPAFQIMDRLMSMGAVIDYYDPYVPRVPETRKYKNKFGFLESLSDDNLNFESLMNHRLTLILTDHDCIDWKTIYMMSNFIVDTRNALSEFVDDEEYKFKVVKA